MRTVDIKLENVKVNIVLVINKKEIEVTNKKKKTGFFLYIKCIIIDILNILSKKLCYLLIVYGIYLKNI